jgi:dihydroflavonol-4-reductase
VRPASENGALTSIGIETYLGDIRSRDDMIRSSDSCSTIINCAALLGGATQDLPEQEETNVGGSSRAYDAGAVHGIRVVTLSSTPFLDHPETLTETSPIAEECGTDPYTVTKRAAYLEAKRRSAEGEDINVVIPGGTFGPGLVVTRAMGPTSFNRALRGALNGRLFEYVTYPVPWVFAEDVATACISAAQVDSSGRTFLAFGQEDAQSTASWLNLACEAAGVAYRVAEVRVEPTNPEHVNRYGATLIELSQRQFPVPWFDNSVTRSALNYQPRRLVDALEQTVAWLKDHDQIS